MRARGLTEVPVVAEVDAVRLTASNHGLLHLLDLLRPAELGIVAFSLVHWRLVPSIRHMRSSMQELTCRFVESRVEQERLEFEIKLDLADSISRKAGYMSRPSSAHQEPQP